MQINFKFILTLACLWLLFIDAQAQNYVANGNATSIGNGCYELTSDVLWQAGTVWYTDKLDLSENFSLEFRLNLGSKDNSGADGMVFVLQTAGTKSLGTAGGDMGYSGFQPSFGVEFDTYQNSIHQDPSYDHVSFVQDGDLTHDNSGVFSAKPVLTGVTNIENNQFIDVKVTWIAITQRLTVVVNCEERLSTVVNLVDDVFSGTEKVYWGFTSSTGGLSNVHTACLSTSIGYPKDYDVCLGDQFRLVTTESNANTYEWSPDTYLNSSVVQRPLFTATESIQYTVKSTNKCGDISYDTIDVNVRKPNTFELGKDTLLCDGAQLSFDLQGLEIDTFYWSDLLRDSIRTIDTAGVFTVDGYSNRCYHRDTIEITTDLTPVVTLRGDTSICDGDSILIQPQNSHPFELSLWQDDNIAPANRFVSQQGRYIYVVQNGCNTVQDTFDLTVVPTPRFTLVNDTFYCVNDSIEISPSVTQSDWEYLWNTGETTSQIFVDEEGLCILQTMVEQKCYWSDTAIITENFLPTVDLDDTINFCAGETVSLGFSFPNADVTWFNGSRDTASFKDYTGPFSVTIENVCGIYQESAFAQLEPCACDVYFPTAFSPNDDQFNDTLRAITECDVRSFNYALYNRWGQKVFETNDVNQGWDGRINGVLMSTAMYVWKAEYTGWTNGSLNRFVESGTLYLIR
jgi:gliding motility-associated-like protein